MSISSISFSSTGFAEKFQITAVEDTSSSSSSKTSSSTLQITSASQETEDALFVQAAELLLEADEKGYLDDPASLSEEQQLELLAAASIVSKKLAEYEAEQATSYDPNAITGGENVMSGGAAATTGASAVGASSYSINEQLKAGRSAASAAEQSMDASVLEATEELLENIAEGIEEDAAAAAASSDTTVTEVTVDENGDIVVEASVASNKEAEVGTESSDSSSSDVSSIDIVI